MTSIVDFISVEDEERCQRPMRRFQSMEYSDDDDGQRDREMDYANAEMEMCRRERCVIVRRADEEIATLRSRLADAVELNEAERRFLLVQHWDAIPDPHEVNVDALIAKLRGGE